MITTAQAAKILGITRTRVLQLCRAGRIEGAEKVGRDWLIPARFRRLPSTNGTKVLDKLPHVE